MRINLLGLLFVVGVSLVLLYAVKLRQERNDRSGTSGAGPHFADGSLPPYS